MDQNAIDALGGADEARKSYFTIGKEGTFRVVVPEGTPGAKTRTYEIDGENGEKVEQSKTEIHKQVLENVRITAINFNEGDFGQSMNLDVTIRDEKSGAVSDFIISIKTGSNYGTSLMERLPNLDLSKEFNLRGYNFESEGKKQQGISVTQGEEKLNSFFKKGEGKDTELLHGYPVVNDEKKPERTAITKWKKFWADYFFDVSQFLADYVKDNVTVPEVEVVVEEVVEGLEKEF